MISRWYADGMREVLERAELLAFDALWDLEAGFVEEPNARRGGWSGVSRIELPFPDGPRPVFLKRQADHLTRTVRHPFAGEPTLHRELTQLRRFADLHIPAPPALHYAHASVGQEWRAVLVVGEVAGRPLTSWLDDYPHASRSARDAVIGAVCALCQRIWSAGFEHRALYAKHLFLDESTSPMGVSIIDLETTRRRSFRPKVRVRDLDSLNRRTPVISRTDRLRFLLKVLGADRVTPEVRTVWARLVERAERRSVS